MKARAVNPQYARIASRTVDELMHLDWMSITHPDDVSREQENMALLNAGTISVFQAEKRYPWLDGTTIWARMTIASIVVRMAPAPTPCNKCHRGRRDAALVTLRQSVDFPQRKQQRPPLFYLEEPAECPTYRLRRDAIRSGKQVSGSCGCTSLHGPAGRHTRSIGRPSVNVESSLRSSRQMLDLSMRINPDDCN
jgi:hypothetical protein